MNSSRWRTAAVAVLTVAVANLGLVKAAQAGIVATDAIVQSSRAADMATVRAQLDRSDVRAQMQKMGVDGAVVDTRVAALSDSELHDLAKQMQDAPAGGDGILVVLGVVFVVLIVLQLVGVIDVFKKMHR